MALTWLALGDSYTIGEGVPAEGRWPHQLAALLRARGIALQEPRTIATTGWTTDELDAGIDAVAPDGPFDFVSLLIGVNNQYRGRSLQEYQQQFSALLQRALAFAGGRPSRVLVLSIPDWGVTPFAHDRDRAAIAEALDGYNHAAQAICNALGIAYVDITDLSRQHGAEAAMLADDGLHPSARMYALWAQRALPLAERLLASAA
ncbi:SGNH/GDSL hydrolase family protein [Stenotrophomonas lacuserhaii]|uniref:SGNH/GDSL hydrolase family protein n=1 Tax=Stenotrophomonas lacuserhaii TaxID=2760084 RepID=UPI0032EE361B